MNDSLFIPQKIKVGFQKRESTYTGMLAYIIYYDSKNKLRKEVSWEGWRDKSIEPLEFDNIPTSGFVINKQVGGYKSDWNYRQSYVRIYDPRGFEFEIGIENLLFILENNNSIKGKGLEGEFVYCYHGKDLVLLPTASTNYEQLQKLNDTRFENKFIKAKDLVVGATYLSYTNIEWVYVGRFDTYDYESYYNWSKIDYGYSQPSKCEKQHWFVEKDSNSSSNIEHYKSIYGKFISVVNSDCVENYSDYYERISNRVSFSPVDINATKFIDYSNIEIEKLKNYLLLKNGYNSIKLYSRKYKSTIDISGYGYSTNEKRITIENKEYPISEFETKLIKDYDICIVETYLKNGKLFKIRGKVE